MEQLLLLHNKYGIDLVFEITKARCPNCNHDINKISDIPKYKKSIPKQVYAYHDEFWKCTNIKCGKIFWNGTHVDDIKLKLNNLRNELNR